jgi:hypothetical protein
MVAYLMLGEVENAEKEFQTIEDHLKRLEGFRVEDWDVTPLKPIVDELPKKELVIKAEKILKGL